MKKKFSVGQIESVLNRPKVLSQDVVCYCIKARAIDKD